MRKMNVSCHHALFATVNKFEVINFALNEVPAIMEMLGLTKEQWAIGGSVAGMLYGIDFGRCPHDVDIIVPVGLMKVIQDRVNHSVLFSTTNCTSSTDVEWGTNHFAFRAIEGQVIDIIEANDFYNEEAKYAPCNSFHHRVYNEVNVMSIKHLYFAKKRYNRAKDYDDVVKLKALYDGFLALATPEPQQPEGVAPGYMDALARLNAQMEGKE